MQERKSRVEIEFPPQAPGCGQTCRLAVLKPRRDGSERIIDQCEYLVREIKCFAGERAFRFSRLDLDRGETWIVRRINAKFSECDCQSGIYKGFCKHISAVAAIIESEKFVESPTTQERISA